MPNYTAADVKKLRDLTGAGMLDSKNALVDADGDFDKAVEVLRIKGAKDVGKRSERATAEGLVAAKGGALIELNSETDFVAKNAEFQTLADLVVAAAVAAKAGDVDALKAAPAGDSTVEQAVADLSAKIGEKLELRRAAYFDGAVDMAFRTSLSRIQARAIMTVIFITLTFGGVAMVLWLGSRAVLHGDISGGQKKLQAAIKKTVLPTAYGTIHLDKYNQGVIPVYYAQLYTKGGKLAVKTVGYIPNVDQTFGGTFSASTPAPGRTSPACVKRSLPWIGKTQHPKVTG